LNKYLEYRDGVLYKKPDKSKSKSWHTRFCNKPITATTTMGYIRFNLNSKMKFAHRVIWEMHYGKIPDGLIIDHINQNKGDNRIENLRLATYKTNAYNTKRKCLGVYNDRGYWKVGFTVMNKWKHYGMFSDYEEAVKTAKQIHKELSVHDI
jgi:hypothetical protein